MTRTANYPIEPLILNRYSPRALSGESITDTELMALFEAARWAPSSYNNQPWRFIYAKRDTPYWQKFLDLLVEPNRLWAQNAAVLIIIASHNNFAYNNKPSRTHSFDTGAAWENLALQATALNLVAHAMEGFNYQAAAELAKLPTDYTVEAMVAVGKHGEISRLPDKLQAGEQPNERKPLDEIVFEGQLK